MHKNIRSHIMSNSEAETIQSSNNSNGEHHREPSESINWTKQRAILLKLNEKTFFSSRAAWSEDENKPEKKLH